MFCTACHGSPHAMVPSREASDNYQAVQYMGKAVAMGSCAACHDSSKGDDEFNEFVEKHAGANPDKMTACHVCHTAISDNIGDWPHQFEWNDR